MPIGQVENKMLKIFKAKKRSYALQKLQGITKLIQAKRVFKVNKRRVINYNKIFIEKRCCYYYPKNFKNQNAIQEV